MIQNVSTKSTSTTTMIAAGLVVHKIYFGLCTGTVAVGFAFWDTTGFAFRMIIRNLVIPWRNFPRSNQLTNQLLVLNPFTRSQTYVVFLFNYFIFMNVNIYDFYIDFT